MYATWDNTTKLSLYIYIYTYKPYIIVPLFHDKVGFILSNIRVYLLTKHVKCVVFKMINECIFLCHIFHTCVKFEYFTLQIYVVNKI